MGVGETAALVAAFLWTISSMIWGRIDLTATTLNFAKNVVGIVMVFAHLVVVAILLQQPLFTASSASWVWLAVSGFIGIFIGDSFFFRSLQVLGPRLALIMSTTAPIFALILGWLFLREHLGFIAVQGVILTIVGVAIVISERKTEREDPGLKPGTLTEGIWCGIGSAVCQALGGVLSRRGYNDLATGESLCAPIEGSFIRILVATIAAIFMMLLRKQLVETAAVVFQWKHLKLIAPATAIGTWLGIWLSQIAFKESDAAIAQTLMATCPLFAIPIMWYAGKYRFTVLSVLGTLGAIVGVFLVVGGWSVVEGLWTELIN